MIRLKLFLNLILWNEVNVWIDFWCRACKIERLIVVSSFKTSIFFPSLLLFVVQRKTARKFQPSKFT